MVRSVSAALVVGGSLLVMTPSSAQVTAQTGTVTAPPLDVDDQQCNDESEADGTQKDNHGISTAKPAEDANDPPRTAAGSVADGAHPDHKGSRAAAPEPRDTRDMDEAHTTGESDPPTHRHVPVYTLPPTVIVIPGLAPAAP